MDKRNPPAPKISKHLNRNYSFDIRASKNHFSILTQSDNLNIKTFDSDYYTIIRQIGTGSYGKIYLVEDPKTKQQFALKKIIIGDAQELKENIKLDGEIIEKTEIAGGYLNFYINSKSIVKAVLEDILSKKENYGRMVEILR